jgi:hypothetical protein
MRTGIQPLAPARSANSGAQSARTSSCALGICAKKCKGVASMNKRQMSTRQLNDLKRVAAWLKNYLETADWLSLETGDWRGEGDINLSFLQRVIYEMSTERSLPPLPPVRKKL